MEDPGARTDPASIDQIVVAYWKHYAIAKDAKPEEVGKDEWFWAWIDVDAEVRAPGPRTFELLLALVDSAKDRDALAYVAAGPIEDLINRHGATFLEEIETGARRNHTFRNALADVRLSDDVPKAVRDRLRGFMPDAE